MFENLGLLLKLERTKAGLTQEQVAQRIHSDKARISSYERGVNLPPVDVLARLAALYHVSTDYLLGLEKNRALFTDGLTDDQIKALEHVALEIKKASGNP